MSKVTGGGKNSMNIGIKTVEIPKPVKVPNMDAMNVLAINRISMVSIFYGPYWSNLFIYIFEVS